MPQIEPSVMLNSIMGKIYNVLTNGDDTVPKSEDNFLTWLTPGAPLDPEDFEFVTQGFTGVVKKKAIQEMVVEGSGEGEEGATNQPELTPALLEGLRAQDASKQYMNAESFARFVDFVPDVAATTNDQFAAMSVMNNEGSLSERIEYVLRMSQVMETKLDEKTKKKIEKFRGLLNTTRTKVNLIDDTETEVSEPSALVNLYMQKMAEYEAAALAYNNARIDALTADNVKAVHYWGLNANILRNRVKAAMYDWVSNGYKNDYEGIAAYIDQVMRRDMSLLKAQYQDNLEKARITGMHTGSDFYTTWLAPGNPFRAAGWTEFTFKSTDFNNSSNSSYKMKRSKSSAGGGWLGIFGGGGSASKASGSSESKVTFDSNHFWMKFSIAQCFITRPWLPSAFINSKCWRFDKNNPESAKEIVSDGGSPPKGLIPAYPTAMSLIKDLDIGVTNSSGFSEAAKSWKRSSASGGGAVHFGPFHFGGSHSRGSASGERSSQFHYDSETQTMKVPGYQCIGFKCHVFPKSPDPLEEIKDWI